jgi:nickel-dependent lactate racemase
MKAAMLGNSYFGRAENPVRHDIEAWTEKIGLHFIINTILDGNQNICSVVAGHYVQAHRAGVELGKRIYFVKAPQKADIVIVDSHPSDGDFWQGTKGFYPSDILLRDGGTSILVAPCLEGEGPHALYARMIGDDHADEVLEKLYRDGCHDVDPLAAAVGAQLSRMRRRYHMAMYTRGLSDEVLKRAKIRRVYDIGGELAALNKQYGGHAVIAVVRCGAEIVPELE